MNASSDMNTTVHLTCQMGLAVQCPSVSFTVVVHFTQVFYLQL
jgi:hypothetical protein